MVHLGYINARDSRFGRDSASSHVATHRFRSARWAQAVLVLHMSSPVVLSRERFRAKEVGAAWLWTVISLLLLMFVIDMSIQVCLGSKLLVAVGVRASVLPVVVSLVVVELMNLVKSSATFLAHQS